MTDDYLTTLAEFVSHTPGEAIPAAVRRRAGLILADCVGCMCAGSRAPEVARLREHLGTRATHPSATVIGTTERMDPDTAAYLGGIAGTWHDLDEGNLHTRTHAAIQIVPALLAEVEGHRRGGREVVDALVLAYEVAGRLWRATSARLAVHPHGTYGPLAASLALARLRGDDAGRMRTAMNVSMTLGIAASRQALGDGATVRNVYTGHSARAAYEALVLRDVGFGGEHDAPGSILGHLYGSAFEPGIALEDLGAEWWIEKNYFKQFASGRYMHAALDGVERLLERLGGGFTGEGLERVTVDTFFLAATMGQQRVDTPFGMRFSIPCAIASRIVRGRPGLLDDGSGAFGDARVHALAKRIFVQENPSMTAAYPDTQPAHVTFHFEDGRRESADVEKILGEHDCPLPPGTLERKFVELASLSIGEDCAQSIFPVLCAMDEQDEVDSVLATLRDGARSAPQGSSA